METIKNKLFKRLGLLAVIVTIAVLLDFAAHSVSQAFYVPWEYFRNKIIFAILYGFIALWLLQKINSSLRKSAIFSAVLAVLLQIKYFLQGYDIFFVILFLFLHFLMFLVPSYVIFRKYPQIFS